MAKTRAIVKRRKAIRNIRKITRTMELIATARFKKAMDRASEAEAYTRKIAELAGDLSATATNVTHPLMQTRAEVKNAVLLVLNSNRGLCGGYNGSILREANAAIARLKRDNIHLQLEVSGRRGIAYYRYQRIEAVHTYTHFEEKPTFEEVEALANRYIADYTAGRIDRVEVAYMKFLNASKQAPVVETLLPLTGALPSKDAAKTGPPAVEYEYLPAPRDILEELLPISFKIRLFKCFLDAAVSEQLARRVAMKTATENAADIIKQLSSQYNRARQSQITTEISEVIGGAAALE